MKKFVIIPNREKDPQLILSNRIMDYLLQHQCECSIVDDVQGEEPECAIIVGGDGTILQAARILVERDIPMIGVNVGHLGFLAEIEVSDLEQTLDSLINDEYRMEQRMMLSGWVQKKNETTEMISALNDIVVGRAGYSRIIQLKIWVNDELLDIYQADGVILSTPTGSTGYNLSAGGPVVNPKSQAIVITPISPHSLSARSIVLSAEDVIRIEIGRVRKSQAEEGAATFDGKVDIPLEPGDVVTVCRSKFNTRLVKLRETSFYEILRSKLNNH
jgi:NAD+ kinase